jgi:hypothetical protein
MSVFAFLLFFAAEILFARRQSDSRATGFLALATGLPALTSAVMAFISLNEIGATCKLCVGVYVASALCLVGAVWLWRRAAAATSVGWRHRARGDERDVDPWGEEAEPEAAAPASTVYLAGAFTAGVLFVAVPLVAWALAAPDHARFIGSCGALDDASDPYGTLVPFAGHAGGSPAIEVLDPLCPACRAFERRLGAAGLDVKMDRKAALFPLDSTCNWMVKGPIHPGACKVSEAVLCAEGRAGEVVRWAFENQDQIREAAAKDPSAALRMVTGRFPELASCLGSAQVRSRLNKSLRWAVRNRLTVLTPQLYVSGARLCDEDVDLGLDFALSRMLERQRAGTLRAAPTPGEPPPPPPVARSAAAPRPGHAPGAVPAGRPSPAAGARPATDEEAAPSEPPATAPEPTAAEPAPAPAPTAPPPPSDEPPKAPAPAGEKEEQTP